MHGGPWACLYHDLLPRVSGKAGVAQAVVVRGFDLKTSRWIGLSTRCTGLFPGH